jgi:hypothetical protein
MGHPGKEFGIRIQKYAVPGLIEGEDRYHVEA